MTAPSVKPSTSTSAAASLALGYLASEYPGVSHTFIWREVQALRDAGIRVATASINRAGESHAPTAFEQQEMLQTMLLKEGLLRRGSAALLRLARRHPLATLRMARAASGMVMRGPKSVLKAGAYLLEAARLVLWAQGEAIRHIHVHFANPAANVAMIAAASGLLDYSLSVHGPDEFYHVDSGLLQEKLQAALFVRVISNYAKGQCMRLLPADQWGKLHVVRLGVDPHHFYPPASRELSLDKPPRILCVGRITPAKGQRMLLTALARCRERGIPFTAKFLGGGDDLETLRASLPALGLSGMVHFDGPANQDAVVQAYAEADVFALPSVAEGLPVVLMEAMAMGLACCSTRITGIPELIKDGKNGLLVDSGDVASLTDALEILLTNAPLRSTLGKAARDTVLQHYDLQVNGQAMARLVRTHLSSTSGRVQR